MDLRICKHFSNKRRLAECGARGDPCKNNRPMEQNTVASRRLFPHYAMIVTFAAKIYVLNLIAAHGQLSS